MNTNTKTKQEQHEKTKQNKAYTKPSSTFFEIPKYIIYKTWMWSVLLYVCSRNYKQPYSFSNVNEKRVTLALFNNWLKALQDETISQLLSKYPYLP